MKAKPYWRVVEVLKAYGFVYIRSVGSHRQFHKPGLVMIVTVPFHGRNCMIKTGILKSIARQSGIPDAAF